MCCDVKKGGLLCCGKKSHFFKTVSPEFPLRENGFVEFGSEGVFSQCSFCDDSVGLSSNSLLFLEFFFFS